MSGGIFDFAIAVGLLVSIIGSWKVIRGTPVIGGDTEGYQSIEPSGDIRELTANIRRAWRVLLVGFVLQLLGAVGLAALAFANPWAGGAPASAAPATFSTSVTQFLTDNPALAYAAGFLYAVALPQWLLPRILRHLWLRVLDHNHVSRKEIERDIVFLPALVGLLERVLYTASIIAGATEFIGVWLAIKVAGGWRGWSEGRKFPGNDGEKKEVTVPGRQEFNLFLVGSGLSLLYAVVGAYSIRWLLSGETVVALVAASLVVAATCALSWWSTAK